MIAEFRAAFQELIDASVAADPQFFAPAVHKVYQLASQVPLEEREQALKVLGPIFAGGYLTPGVAADLSVVAGALVEIGTRPGDTGADVLRLAKDTGQSAAVFLHAWKETGSGEPPEPEQVTAAEEERVAQVLGETAPAATMSWWTSRRYGLAAKTMLSDAGVRAAVRADPELRAELTAIANQLSAALPEFGEVRSLLRMAEATSALVLDRASGRGFRVLFEGIGDNFQLHTLLADALIGPEGRGIAGERPDPRWTASFVDADPDPEARIVRGWWNMVTADGSWVWNEGVPADISMVEGERVLVLEEQPYERSWNAGRVHPHVRGWLDIDEELSPEEAAAWWRRVKSPDSPQGPAAAAAEVQAPQFPDWAASEEATSTPFDSPAEPARSEWAPAVPAEPAQSEWAPESPAAWDHGPPVPPWQNESAGYAAPTPLPEPSQGPPASSWTYDEAPAPISAPSWPHEDAAQSAGAVSEWAGEQERHDPVSPWKDEYAAGDPPAWEQPEPSGHEVPLWQQEHHGFPPPAPVEEQPAQFTPSWGRGEPEPEPERAPAPSWAFDPNPAPLEPEPPVPSWARDDPAPEPEPAPEPWPYDPTPEPEPEPVRGEDAAPAPDDEPAPPPPPVRTGPPPGAGLLPPLPPGVSDSATWGPTWR